MTWGRALSVVGLAILAVAPACHTDKVLSDDRDAATEDHPDTGAGGTGTAGGGSSAGGSVGTGGGTGGGTGAGGNEADTCVGNTPGTCAAALTCLDCPSGPTTLQYLCTTTCRVDTDCTDPSRPLCNHPTGGDGVCTTSTFVCQWTVRCASPLTMIATPSGLLPISSLGVGNLVYSVHHGEVSAVPVLRTFSAPVVGHHVVRVALASGRVLEISEGHPTASGRLFSDLAPGDHLGTERVTGVESIPYRFTHTFDILPASDTSTYFAEGALIGSTLASPVPVSDTTIAPPARPR